MPFSLGLPLQEDLPTYIIMTPMRLLKLYKGQNTTNTTIMKDMTLFRFKMFQENKTGPSPRPQNKILGKVTSYSYLTPNMPLIQPSCAQSKLNMDEICSLNIHLRYVDIPQNVLLKYLHAQRR